MSNKLLQAVELINEHNNQTSKQISLLKTLLRCAIRHVDNENLIQEINKALNND